MSQTTPPTVDALPAAPNTNSPTNFSTLMDAFLAALLIFRTQMVALAANVFGNGQDAAASAASASISAAAAAVSAGVITWVSGTTYAIGDVRFSPANSATYRRRTAGAGTTDPSADATNWAIISNGAGATVASIKAGSSSVEPLTPAGTLAAMGFTAYMQSADAAITAGGSITIAHGLGRVPVLIQPFIKVLAAQSDMGFSAGLITPVGVGNSGGTFENAGLSILSDATNITIRFGSATGSLSILNFSTGASGSITNSKWNIFVKAWA